MVFTHNGARDEPPFLGAENAIYWDGSLRCDMYEIFVGSVNCVLSIACWIVSAIWMEAAQKGKYAIIMTHK